MIEVNHLNKTFAGVRVLKQISFHIPKGSLAALLGPNGAGKSTLIKSILGITNPDQHDPERQVSKARFSGTRWKRSSRYANHGSMKLSSENMPGYMPQVPAFPKHLSVAEVIDFFESLNQTKPIEKENLISDMNMSQFMYKNIYSLSHGMKQKVNILQCFMFDRSVFILDEPTAGLDPDTAYYLKKLLLQKSKSGKTILFTSHIMSEVEELANEMFILLDGKIILHGQPQGHD